MARPVKSDRSQPGKSGQHMTRDMFILFWKYGLTIEVCDRSQPGKSGQQVTGSMACHDALIREAI